MAKGMQSSVVASNNAWIGEEYSPLLMEKINVMLKREGSSIPCDYLNTSRLGLSHNHNPHLDTFDMEFRQKIAEWMFKVIDFYDLDRDIVNTAMNYLDRYLASSTLHYRLSKNQTALVSTASLKLAIKVSWPDHLCVNALFHYFSHSLCYQLLEPRTFHMSDMIKLRMCSSFSFSPKQIIGMEHDILFALGFDVMPCTVLQFAHYIICMIPSIPSSTRYVLQELSKYMSELAVCVYKFVAFKPSVKALSVVTCAIDSLDADSEISTESHTEFALRVYNTFELWHDDEEITMLKEELKNLICHNTNLTEFVKLIRASHKEEEEVSASVSPKSTVVTFA